MKVTTYVVRLGLITLLLATLGTVTVYAHNASPLTAPVHQYLCREGLKSLVRLPDGFEEDINTPLSTSIGFIGLSDDYRPGTDNFITGCGRLDRGKNPTVPSREEPGGGFRER